MTASRANRKTMTENRIWTFGAAVVILAIIGLGWLLGISPKLAEADAATSARVLVDQQNEEHAARLVVLRDQFENLADIKRELSDLQKELPSHADVEGFIEYATGVATQAGVVISTITALEPAAYGTGDAVVEEPAEAPAEEPAEAPAEGGTTTPAPDQGAPVAGAGSGLYSIGISVEVEGSPEQVMTFARLLQESKRIFLSTQVTFDSGGQGILGGTVTGHLFVLGSAEPTS
jgi:hypothetical protein